MRHVRWSGITTAPEILVELHKSIEWATVTISQVRRINTACKKLEPQLDAEAKAAKRKADEKARDSQRDRSGRARPAEERAKQQRRIEKQKHAARHLYDLEPMEFAGLIFHDRGVRSAACAYIQPPPPASSGQSEPGTQVVEINHIFGSHASWSQGLEFLAKLSAEIQAKAVCIVVPSSAIQHPQLPYWIQERGGTIVQVKARGLSRVCFMTSSSDSRARETFNVDLNELDLLPTVLGHLPVPVPTFGRTTNPWAGDSDTPTPAIAFDPLTTSHDAWWQRLRTHGLFPGQNACTWLESDHYMRAGRERRHSV